MAHVNCPSCGKRLHLPDDAGPVRARCPQCKQVFQTAADNLPAPKPGYSEEGLGRPVKAALIGLCLAGVGLLGFLAYSASRPSGQSEPAAKPVATAGQRETPSPEPAVPERPTPPARKPDVFDRAAEQMAKEAEARQLAMGKIKTPADLYAWASPAVVRVVVRDEKFKVLGFGSGFFVSADGLLVTNHHVIEGANFATILLSNNATLFVEGVAATDPKNDLALLKVNGADLSFLSVDADLPPKVGARVYAIGNPKGMTNTLSEGLVSGLRKVGQQPAVIQTTAPISKGSSGGPLLTADGKVIGVTSAFLAKGQNLNFAVPAGEVRKLLRDRGKLRTLASAGGTRLDKAETDELDKAWEAMAKQDWSTATAVLVGLRKAQPKNPFVRYALGNLHSRLGNHDIAVACYKQAIALKPDYAVAYFNMGVN